MVATKVPFGAISETLIDSIMYHDGYDKYYIIDKYGSHIEVEQNVYLNLKEKGVKETCR